MEIHILRLPSSVLDPACFRFQPHYSYVPTTHVRVKIIKLFIILLQKHTQGRQGIQRFTQTAYL